MFRGIGWLGTSALATFVACSSTTSNPSDAGPSASMCTKPGAAVSGPQDTHCAGVMQVVDPAACFFDAGSGGDDSGGGADASGDDGGGDAGGADAGDIGNCGDSAFGATNYNNSSGDDDCKYDVSWTSTPICEGAPGVYFTVTAKHRSDGSPVTGANPRPDVVLNCNHPIPNTPGDSPELTPGTYRVGPVIFDMPGRWVFRFHFNETCTDLPQSPHGHAAYYVQVP
jgi:hypothetical protein